MDKSEVLVITPQVPMGARDINYARELILKQKEEGVVMLPFGYKVLIKPHDVEIELGPDKDENKVIHNAVTYICMADKNNHGVTADQIAKVLYDRAYRKGFEAGKIEGKKEGRVKVKEVPVKDEDYCYNGGL
jgi:hypothetical protein